MEKRIRITLTGYLQLLLFLSGVIPVCIALVSSDGGASKTGLYDLLFGVSLVLIGVIGNWLSMLIDAIKSSRVGWALAIFFLSPFGCWLYYLLVYVASSGNYVSADTR